MSYYILQKEWSQLQQSSTCLHFFWFGVQKNCTYTPLKEIELCNLNMYSSTIFM